MSYVLTLLPDPQWLHLMSQHQILIGVHPNQDGDIATVLWHFTTHRLKWFQQWRRPWPFLPCRALLPCLVTVASPLLLHCPITTLVTTGLCSRSAVSSFHVCGCACIYLFSTRVWTHSLMLARQALEPLHQPSSFLISELYKSGIRAHSLWYWLLKQSFIPMSLRSIKVVSHLYGWGAVCFLSVWTYKILAFGKSEKFSVIISSNALSPILFLLCF
jgi:hypothetical protein